MRCKPGDLAIVIHSECGNEGRIVQVIRTGWPLGDKDTHHHWWVCEARGIRGCGIDGAIKEGSEALLPDIWLRPLPGDLKEDETEREKELVE